jgi:hypothetical protein
LIKRAAWSSDPQKFTLVTLWYQQSKAGMKYKMQFVSNKRAKVAQLGFATDKTEFACLAE